ncbi:DoxX family protein [Teredinibacter purpureus]|uniref:DoxX family protein n=1 Tax=Teredinibacter purpureus TaxID=2731756 RepID=UPI0005F76D9C|nr:DoxX family protein [Teredinibacter purpureus]
MTIFNKIDRFAKTLGDIIPEAVLSISARVSVFMIFWLSAQTKIGGDAIFGQKWMFWNVSQTTLLLFEYDYALPLIPADIAAYLASITEFLISILILVGFMTRASALIFIIMTLIIEIFVYPEAWATHLLWLVPLLYILKQGAGVFSVDSLLKKT